MWVVTRGLNMYDQDGEYLETVYANKPTKEQLKKYMGCSDESAQLLYDGYWKDGDNVWYYLTELKEGEKYIPYN